MSEGLRDIVDRMVDALNAHDSRKFVSFLDTSHMWETDLVPDAPLRGREAYQSVLENYFEAFSDVQFEKEQVLIAGNTTILSWFATGTHNGPYMGHKPTGRSISIQGCTILLHRNGGKVAHSTTYMNQAVLLRQIGALSEIRRAVAS